jgi:phosphoribosyl 1,2-cyclic phosphate phosphodiesterase
MEIPSRSLDLIRKRPEILVMPLTGIHKLNYHMSLAQVLDYIEIIRPKRAVLNHMSATCDYEKVNALTPQIVVPAYDDMIVEW